MTTWMLNPGDDLDLAPEVPIFRTQHDICAERGPSNLRCDRHPGHSGRHHESIWDGVDETEVRFVIGVWGGDYV